MKKIFFILYIFLLMGCQKEDNNGNECISLDEAQNFLMLHEKQNKYGHSHLAFIPKWETFIQEKINKQQYPSASVKVEFKENKNIEAYLFFEKTLEGINGKMVFPIKEKSNKKDFPTGRKKINLEPGFSASYIFGDLGVYSTKEYPELLPYEKRIEQILKNGVMNTPKCDKCGNNIYNLNAPYSLVTRFEKEDAGIYDKELCDECNEKINYLAEVVFTAKREKKTAPTINHPFIMDIYFPLDDMYYFMESPLFFKLLKMKEFSNNGYLDPKIYEEEERKKEKEKRKHIIYEDIPPCIKDIVQQLEDLNENNTDFSSLDESGGNIAPYILNFFKNSSRDHITFTKEALPYEENGYTIPKGSNYYQIVLNENLLRKGSKLYIAKTIIHESVHALIFSELDRRGARRDHDGDLVENIDMLYNIYKNDTNLSYNDKHALTQHEFISQFVTAMSLSLKKFDGGEKPLEYYQYLLWDGLDTTNKYRHKSPSERDIILKTAEYEKNKGGSGCY